MRNVSELGIIRFVLINCSMCLTAWFGWSLSADVPILGVLLALIFAMITRGVGRFFLLAAKYQRMGAYSYAVLWLGLGAACGVVNILTDYGTSAAIRDASIVASTNENVKARDIRGEVKRLEKRIAEIRGTTSWRTTFLAPDAYDKMIVAAELIRDNEAKRGGCGRICEQKTKELQQLRADKANAEHRLALKAELVQLERELKDAKAASADTQQVSNPAIAQVKSIVAWVGLSKEASDNKIWWGNQGIMLVTCILMTAAIIGLSIEQGLREGSPIEAPAAPVYAAPRALPDATPLHAENPAQAAAERDQRMSVYREVRTETQLRDESWERLREQIRQLGGTSGFDARKAEA